MRIVDLLGLASRYADERAGPPGPVWDTKAMEAKTETRRTGGAQTVAQPGWTSGWPQSPSDFATLIDVFQDRLVRYAFCRLRDVGEAEDTVQEVFLKAYIHRSRLRNVSTVAPYLYRMVYNECMDRLRRPRPALIPIDEIKSEDLPRPRLMAPEQVAAAEQLKRADELLYKLPTRQAEVLRLRLFGEHSYQEVAEICGCSLGTVKSRLRYGVARLRLILARTKETTP